MKMMARLSRFFTLMKTVPFCGQVLPGGHWALAKAIPKSWSMPMTSPVDFISGPRSVSTPGKRLKGKTDSLTAICSISTSWVKPSSSRVFPTITLAASLARGTPVALQTKGTVREARGLTSRT